MYRPSLSISLSELCIYNVILVDCLDNGNNKKALQEAEKLLKKQKDFPCAKVWLF